MTPLIRRFSSLDSCISRPKCSLCSVTVHYLRTTAAHQLAWIGAWILKLQRIWTTHHIEDAEKQQITLISSINLKLLSLRPTTITIAKTIHLSLVALWVAYCKLAFCFPGPLKQKWQFLVAFLILRGSECWQYANSYDMIRFSNWRFSQTRSLYFFISCHRSSATCRSCTRNLAQRFMVVYGFVSFLEFLFDQIGQQLNEAIVSISATKIETAAKFQQKPPQFFSIYVDFQT